MKKIIWITGASTGIGAATALKLAMQGHVVIATARSENKLQELSEQSEAFTGDVIPMVGDVTNESSMQLIVDKIEAEHGAIDLVLLNAGIYQKDPVHEFTAEIFKYHFDINVYGVIYALQPALERFLQRGRGHIAIVSSVAGYRGLPRSISYSSSKAALINLAESLYIECKPKGVKVQVICPGFVKTPLTDKNDFDMPMLMELDDAAEALVKGLNSDRFEVQFPWVFCMIKRMIDLLPNRIYLWLIGWAVNR